MTSLKQLKIEHEDSVYENPKHENELDDIYIHALTAICMGGCEKKTVKNANKKIKKLLEK